MSDWVENGRLLVREVGEEILAIRTNLTSCQVCLLDSERLAVMMDGHPSSMGRHSISSIHRVLSQIATIFLMSVEWSLRRTFRLWSYSRQMTPLAI